MHFCIKFRCWKTH